MCVAREKGDGIKTFTHVQKNSLFTAIEARNEDQSTTTGSILIYENKLVMVLRTADLGGQLSCQTTREL